MHTEHMGWVVFESEIDGDDLWWRVFETEEAAKTYIAETDSKCALVWAARGELMIEDYT